MLKKALLGTTAIASAAFFSPEAFSADPPKLSFLGYYRVEAFFTDQDFTSGRASGFHLRSDDLELQFRAQATADNGLRYEAYVELDLDNTAGAAPARISSPVVDEANLRFQGDWGILDLGDQDGAEDSMNYGGELFLLGNFGFDGGIAATVNTRGVGATLGPDLLGDSSDATKITYYSPRIMGFQAGISFTPDTGQDFSEPQSNNSTGEYRNNIGLGLNYQEKFGDFTVGLSGVGIFADPDLDPDLSTANTSTSIEDARSYQVGGFVTMKEWSIGANYGDSGDTGLNKQRAGGFDAGQFYDVAIGWSSGPYKVAVGYLHSWKGEGTGVSDDEVDFFTVGGQYLVAPGLETYAEYDYVDIDQSDAANSDNKAHVLILGTRLFW